MNGARRVAARGPTRCETRAPRASPTHRLTTNKALVTLPLLAPRKSIVRLAVAPLTFLAVVVGVYCGHGFFVAYVLATVARSPRGLRHESSGLRAGLVALSCMIAAYVIAACASPSLLLSGLSVALLGLFGLAAGLILARHVAKQGAPSPDP